MRSGIQCAVGLIVFAAVCAAQSDLPPERIKLAHIRMRMQQNQEHLPNYTCLETITRERRPSSALVLNARGKPNRYLRQDVVRLEVAEVDGREFFAWPGARNFTETEISTFVTGGLSGNGLFSIFARNIFDPAKTSYRFVGETSDSGRPLLRYDFKVSLLSSGYQLKTIYGQATVPYSGTIWADAKTLDTVRLDIRTEDIPPELRVWTAGDRIDYGRVQIGAQTVLLPQSAEMTLTGFNHWDDRNTIAFTHCKEYGASSVISFGPSDIVPSAAAAPAREIEIPAGLTVGARLETALSSETSTPGGLVHARVEADVKHKGRILIPKDTVVTGHIRRFDQYLVPVRRFEIALEFYRFEFPRGPVRFFAELEKITGPAGSAPLTIVRAADLPGIAAFSVKGDSLALAPGTRLLWKTSRYSSGSP
jgi:hypothetical protein